MTMKTHTKAALTIVIAFIAAITIILTFTVYFITVNGNEDIEKYQAEEIHRIERSLKNYVDMAYATIEANYKNSMNKIYLETYYGQRLENIIDVAEAILKSKADAVKKEELTLSEAQEKAKAEISVLKYDNGNGYVWINDTTLPYPKIIMHPSIPSNQVMKDPKYNCALGKEQNLYQAIVEICQANGKGFVDYLWPQQTQYGLRLDEPKLAYVKLFEEWDWIIGTSVYVDKAMNDSIEKTKDDLRRMKYENGIGYFWIAATQPSLQVIMHSTQPSLEDQILEGQLKTLYESFVRICEEKNGKGFWEYKWPKRTEDGAKKQTPKLSYVRLHEPLGWIVGTDIYLDGMEKIVDEKRKLVETQIHALILKIVAISLVIILLISLLSYRLSKCLPSKKAKSIVAQVPTMTTASIFSQLEATETISPPAKPQPTSKMSRAEAPFTPKETTAATTAASPEKCIPVNECTTMVQEISKTLISEHLKLFATTIPAISQNNREREKEEEVIEEVKELAQKTYQTIEKVKEMVETGQLQYSESTQQPEINTVKTIKSRKVMNDLNKMVR
ncbi:cache domain-containing protein [Candidatus Parabeggiatoa sp. HSG14]|uniref:cache domain-containing protein n=1 Tax=Candidatus Parabeggiatoa sp. HSG14 TaxID=3055593 RepID=UPI0025A89FE0|nr:cache domain-containing protein [Thiotrichales bacterium HSG14]